MLQYFWILAPLFFFVSLLYSSVGLGGGSSYIALLCLFGIPLAKIPPLAFIFNILAASVALYKFHEEKHILPRLALPFLLASVPATFFGAMWKPEERVLSLLFAAVLFSISLMLLFTKKEVKPKRTLQKKTTWLLSLFLGGPIGFLGGLMGIGGGVLLGPVMLKIGMASPRQVICTCSVFVLVNSAAGLIFHFLQGGVEISFVLLLGFAVLAGAQVGTSLSRKKLSFSLLQRIFAILLLVVSFKLSFAVFQ